MLPLSTVLSVSMTQIVSTLARLSQWAWHPGHTPAFQSALYPILTDNMFPPDLLQELVSARPGHGGIPHCVQLTGAALPAGAASTKLVSPKFHSPLVSLSVKTSLGSCPVGNLLVLSDR